jgi:hypothetical protein
MAKGSVHDVGDYNFAGEPVHNVYDLSTTQGKQVSIGSSNGNGTFVVMSPQMAYVQGDTTALEQNLQMNRDDARKYAGKWIAVPSSSSFYAGASSGLTVSSLLTNVTPSAPLSLTKPTTIDGKSVVGVSGGLPSWAQPYVGTFVLYISTEAPYLPVADVVHGIDGSGKTMTGTDHMSNFGKPLNLTAPANSIPIS